MPSNLMFSDNNFPKFTEGESEDEKIRIILNYLYMLLEQLRYSFGNIGVGNFNESELDSLANIITKPVYMQLSDVEGNILSLSVEAGLLSSRITSAEGGISNIIQTGDMLAVRVSNAEGNISTLTQTANSIGTRVTSVEGSVSTLTQTANSIGTRVTNAEGNISTLTQTATSLTTRISNAEGNISYIDQKVNSISLGVYSESGTSSLIYITVNGVTLSSSRISFYGVVTFNDLIGSGQTVINGDNIRTGTISGITLFSRSNVPLWVGARCSVRRSDGNIDFGYSTSSFSTDFGFLYGKIYTDVVNSRFYIGSAYGTVLKVYSGGNMSIDAENYYTIYIGTEMGTRQTVTIGNSNGVINLNGTVYVNGRLI